MTRSTGSPHRVAITVGVMWGVGDRLTAADDAMLGILGYTRAQFETEGVDWRRATPPEYLHLDEAGIRQASEGSGFTAPYRKEFVRRDGSRVPVLLVCAFLPGDAGEWMGYVVDLSPSPKPEQPPDAARVDRAPVLPEEFYRRLVGELVADRTRLHAMLDNSVAPLWAVDRERRLLGSNAAFQEAQRRVSGRELEVLESVMGPQFPEADRAMWDRWYERALGGEVVTGHTRLEAEGRVLRHEHLLSPMRDSRGHVYGVAVVSHDVSERAAMEDAMRASEARFRTLALASPLGVFLADAAGRCVFGNARLAEIWGIDAAALPGTSMQFRVHPDDAAGVAARWAEARAMGKELRLEHRIELPGGVERHLRVWAAPLHDAAGDGGFVGSVEDETERRAAADRAQRRVRMESLGTLAGGVAHDFNNMLSVVLGYTDLASADAEDRENVRVALEEIRTASLRARELVSQILTFSRQGERETGLVDLTALVAESGKLLRAILQPNVEFKVRAPAESVWVQGNVAALQQVIVNLCINASHALRDVAKPSITVTLAVGQEDAVPVAHLTVRDNGCGMSRAIADRIFEPFFTTKPMGEGTGMGLAVVHGTVIEHGGSIRVHSVPDVGTTFEIALPLSVETVEERPPARTTRPGAGRILLVEDERAVARVLTRTLEHAGYTVIGSHDGLDALRLLDALQAPPDLVLSDVSMPRMSGDRLAEELAVRLPGLPVILMTGFSRETRLDGPVGGNVREVLQKPITSQQLLDAIARVTAAAGAG